MTTQEIQNTLDSFLPSGGHLDFPIPGLIALKQLHFTFAQFTAYPKENILVHFTSFQQGSRYAVHSYLKDFQCCSIFSLKQLLLIINAQQFINTPKLIKVGEKMKIQMKIQKKYVLLTMQTSIGTAYPITVIFIIFTALIFINDPNFLPQRYIVSCTVIYQHQFPFIPPPSISKCLYIFLQENTLKTFSISLTEKNGIIMVSDFYTVSAKAFCCERQFF